MGSLNILLVNHYAGSNVHGMVFRPFYLGREWVRMGHKVTIVAASFAHVRTRSPDINGTVTEEYLDGIRYIWLKTPRYTGNNFGRVCNILTFLSRLYLCRNEVLRGFRPEVIIASSTYVLDIFVANRLAHKYNAKLIFEVRDLWPLTPMMLGGMGSRHPFIVPLRVAEDFAYRNSDKVVSVLSGSGPYMESRGMEASKFVHIPNGIDPLEWETCRTRLPGEHADLLARLRSEGRFVVAYCGSHGLAMDLDTLVQTASLLRNEALTVVLVGQGPEKERLQAIASVENLNNVVFLPPVPKGSMPDLLTSMDALYIGLRKSPLFKFGVSSNKLLDYMMAARPVIHAVESADDIVAESGCGISISPESASELAQALIRMMRTPPTERDRMGMKGKDYVLEHRDYRILAKRFLDAIECIDSEGETK